MRRLSFALAASILAAAVLALSTERGVAVDEVQEGGTFRISYAAGDFDSVDPARSYSTAGWALLDLTCARLMTYPDAPPPAGFRLVPEVSAGFPRVSRDRRTYTFTLRTNFRFSNGTPVRASAFARAINRTLAPGMDSPGAQYTQDIVGAEAVLAGRAKAASGVSARGNRLVIRLKRPVPEFAAWTTMPFFCAVPPTCPPTPRVPAPSRPPGRTTWPSTVPARRVILRRNRVYEGRRPQRVDRFEVDLQPASFADVIERVERGQADWGRVSAARRSTLAAGSSRSTGSTSHGSS